MKTIGCAAALAAGILVTGAVTSFAADMPLKARPLVAPAWSWTGFYGGINGGYAVGSDPFTQGYVGNINNPVNLSTISTVNSTIVPKGGFAGLQDGYNYQIGSLVWGVEGDWQWADQKARSCGLSCSFTQTPDNVGDFRFGASGTAGSLSVDQKINWFATARGRVGWTPIEGTMLYATAGGAWMGVDETDQIRYVQALAGNVFTTTASFSNTKSGYAVGGGAEFRLWGNWTGKVEYLHIDVSGTNNSAAHFATPVIGPIVLTTTTSTIRNDLVRVGLNYKVNPWESASASPAMPVKAAGDGPWNWTGFYVGGNAGYGQASENFLQNLVRTNTTYSYSYYNHSIAPKGELLGLQGGYNYQTGAIVVGVEGDWQWADQNARSCGLVCSATTSTPPFGTNASNISIDQKINWFATARARIGWTLANGTLLYATGGGAWMGINETDTFISTPAVGAATSVMTTVNNTKAGYAFGGGAEFRIWGNWTGKVEYLHLDVGGVSVTNGPDAVRVTTNTGRIKDDIARAGLNYHFAGPVVAKY